MPDDALNRIFNLDNQEDDIDKAILESKATAKPLTERASDYWNSDYATDIINYGLTGLSGYQFANKVKNIYGEEKYKVLRGVAEEKKAIEALKSGQPLEGKTVIQKGGTSAKPLYKNGQPYYQEGASSRVSTIRPTTPTRLGNYGLSGLTEAQLQSEINRNTVGRALRYLLPEARTPDIYQDGKLITRGTPLRITQSQPTVEFRAIENKPIPKNGQPAPRMSPPEVAPVVDIAPYGIGEHTRNIGLVTEDGKLFTGVNQGKDIKLIPTGSPPPKYEWQVPETAPPSPMITGGVAKGVRAGQVIQPKYVNPRIDPELWARNTANATKWGVGKVWDGTKWVLTNPIVQKTAIGLDALGTGLNAVDKYQYNTAKYGTGAGVVSAGTELTRIPANYYTMYIPAMASMAVNAVTPKDFPSVDLLNPPTFLRDYAGLMNPYGIGYGEGLNEPVMTGPDGQVYGP